MVERILADSEGCRKDVSHVSRHWNCSDWYEYEDIMKIFVIDCFAICTIQVVVFSWLLIRLMLLECRRSSSIGKLPIVISTLTIINGICNMIRTWSMFPAFGTTTLYKIYATFYFFEDVSFYLAVFLFGAMYYEVSLDIERMMKIGSG